MNKGVLLNSKNYKSYALKGTAFYKMTLFENDVGTIMCKLL